MQMRWTAAACVAVATVMGLAGVGCAPGRALGVADIARVAQAEAPVTGTDVAITWYGVSGFKLRDARRTILIDPYVSRHGLWRLLFGRLTPDQEAVRTIFAGTRADAVLISHAHFDHVADAAAVALVTGATIYGSASACQIARAYGAPAGRCVVIAVDRPFEVNGATVTALASRHVLIGGRVPFGGEVREAPVAPLRMADMRAGPAMGFLLEMGGQRIYHHGSAGVIDRAVGEVRADTLLLGIGNAGATRDYVRRVVGAVRPGAVIMCHHDDFMVPFADPVPLMESPDALEAAVTAVRRVVPEARVIIPRYFEIYVVGRTRPPAGGLS